jgi:hypothetical protein
MTAKAKRGKKRKRNQEREKKKISQYFFIVEKAGGFLHAPNSFILFFKL